MASTIFQDLLCIVHTRIKAQINFQKKNCTVLLPSPISKSTALPYSSYSQYLVSSQFVAHTTMKRWWMWYIVLTFVLLSPSFTVLGVEIFVKRKSDLNTVAGARAELVCEVRDLRDELKYCEWFSPNGK